MPRFAEHEDVEAGWAGAGGEEAPLVDERFGRQSLVFGQETDTNCVQEEDIDAAMQGEDNVSVLSGGGDPALQHQTDETLHKSLASTQRASFTEDAKKAVAEPVKGAGGGQQGDWTSRWWVGPVCVALFISFDAGKAIANKTVLHGSTVSGAISTNVIQLVNLLLAFVFTLIFMGPKGGVSAMSDWKRLSAYALPRRAIRLDISWLLELQIGFFGAATAGAPQQIVVNTGKDDGDLVSPTFDVDERLLAQGMVVPHEFRASAPTLATLEKQQTKSKTPMFVTFSPDDKRWTPSVATEDKKNTWSYFLVAFAAYSTAVVALGIATPGALLVYLTQLSAIAMDHSALAARTLNLMPMRKFERTVGNKTTASTLFEERIPQEDIARAVRDAAAEIKKKKEKADKEKQQKASAAARNVNRDRDPRDGGRDRAADRDPGNRYDRGHGRDRDSRRRERSRDRN
eukprot:g12785.t1